MVLVVFLCRKQDKPSWVLKNAPFLVAQQKRCVVLVLFWFTSSSLLAFPMSLPWKKEVQSPSTLLVRYSNTWASRISLLGRISCYWSWSDNLCKGPFVVYREVSLWFASRLLSFVLLNSLERHTLWWASIYPMHFLGMLRLWLLLGLWTVKSAVWRLSK